MDWFIADPHIGHRNIIKYCNRPFIDPSYPEDDDRRYLVELMDETLVSNWNSVVDDKDRVFVVGDMAYHCDFDYADSIVARLKGNKVLVPGNHDRSLALRMRRFTWITPLILDIKINHQHMTLCHYPILDWHHCQRGTWHLFGHVHGLRAPYGKCFDVGVDCWNFFPISFDQVKEKMDSLPIGDHPQFHGYVPKPEVE